MNMHTLLASRPNVVASTRRDALGGNGALHESGMAVTGTRDLSIESTTLRPLHRHATIYKTSHTWCDSLVYC